MPRIFTSSTQGLIRPFNYLVICVLAMINVVILVTSPRADLLMSAMPMLVVQGVALLLMRILIGWRLRGQTSQVSIPLTRLHIALEGMFFLHIAWINLRLLNHLSMMLPFPYADQLLAGWDQALHINWMAYFDAVVTRPSLYAFLDIAYTSLTALSVVVLLLLVSFGYTTRAREFIDTFLITAIICIVIGAAFPAKAAVLTLTPDLSALTALGVVPGAYHMPYLEALRDSTRHIMLHPAQLPGLVTFPSFHTASGILIISACRKTWLSIPAWLYSTAMIAATPVHGGHYIVDLIAGVVVALLVIKLVKTLDFAQALHAPNHS